jgi:DNA helicase-2/ATP-dependent DNA helicase PcrA
MTDVERLLADLTDPQRRAVLHGDGPLLVLAGAGSGKTRVITRRAAHLAATACEPWQVLAITFTNKAAEEMRQRIQALGVGRGMWVCTFHSMCARLLRQFADRAGLPADFGIVDQSDRLQLIRQAITRCDLSTQNWPPGRVEQVISRAKNDLVTPEQYAELHRDFSGRTVSRVYAAYEALLAEQHGADFDDLLIRLARLLEEDAELRDQLEDRFRYLLIDEYQDTNYAQYLIARGLSQSRRNLSVVGDPDQSIYGWRGASIRNILEFEEDFPDAKVIHLEQNYRSSQRILAAAGALIAANRQRKEKGLWTRNDLGVHVVVAAFEDAEQEARHVAEQLAAYRRDGGRLGDAAVFYRVNALSRVLEEALRREGLPYQIARGVEFYNRKEIKDCLAYLRVRCNPADEVSLLRIINTPPRGIGKVTVDRLRQAASASGRSLLDVVRDVEGVSTISAAAASKVRAFARLLDQLAALPEAPVQLLVEQTLSLSGLNAMYGPESDAPDSDAAANLAELVTAAREYDEQTEGAGSLMDWLTNVSLASDVDMLQEGGGAVTLMTLHAAKGLEFPVVYITGLEQGLLPHLRSMDSRAELEEERRLCFVGMTRAMHRLTLSLAQFRTIAGVAERRAPSQFLQDLPRDQVEWLDLTAPSERSRFRRAPTIDASSFRVGQWVRHPEYGVGQLRWIRANGRQTRVGVQFKSVGDKVLIAEYAKLEPVEADEVFDD